MYKNLEFLDGTLGAIQVVSSMSSAKFDSCRRGTDEQRIQVDFVQTQVSWPSYRFDLMECLAPTNFARGSIAYDNYMVTWIGVCISRSRDPV